MVAYEACYLKPVMTPVAWVAGIWLAALDLHLSHRGMKTLSKTETISNQHSEVRLLKSVLGDK